VCNTVGRVIGVLPEGKAVIGVTSLDNNLYVLRNKSSEQIEVYDIDSYCLQRQLTVHALHAVFDIVACGYNGCAYVSDTSHVHRVALGFSIRPTPKWPVNENGLLSLSLTAKHNLLVTCCEVRKIKEFTTNGKLLREVVLPEHVCSPGHTVQLSSGELIVCHGKGHDPLALHRVCQISSDGQVVKSYGGPPGAGSQQMKLPAYMAADGNDFIFVADLNNHRVLLLSPTLTYVREVVSREQLQCLPRGLSLDVQRRRLYVADDEYKDGKLTAGRVIVVNV